VTKSTFLSARWKRPNTITSQSTPKGGCELGKERGGGGGRRKWEKVSHLKKKRRSILSSRKKFLKNKNAREKPLTPVKLETALRLEKRASLSTKRGVDLGWEGKGKKKKERKT